MAPKNTETEKGPAIKLTLENLWLPELDSNQRQAD